MVELKTYPRRTWVDLCSFSRPFDLYLVKFVWSVDLVMAFLAKRWYSSGILTDPYNHARPSVATPCPVHQGAVLESPQLQQLAQKARGPWKELTKEEIVQCKMCGLYISRT